MPIWSSLTRDVTLLVPSAPLEPSTVLGLNKSKGIVFAVIAAVVAASASIGVALYSLRRVDRRECHRWLREKRREAHVEFMTAARTA